MQSKKSSLPITFSGVVTRFKGNGRQLGYPTANIAHQTSLEDGVYFGFASLSDYQDHPALIFIGTPTTVGDTQHRVEAHLLDIPDKDYYGLQLDLRVEHFYRPNQTFKSIKVLQQYIKQDETDARAWFKQHTPAQK